MSRAWHSLSTYRALPSWLVLGPSGREHASAGAAELEASLVAAGGALRADVCRGLSGDVDLSLLLSAPSLGVLETFARGFATRTVGRHLELRAHRLCVGVSELPEGELALFASIRGPVEALPAALLAGAEPEARAVALSTLGPHPGDLLLAAFADDPEALLRFFGALSSLEPLAASPVARLAFGRQEPLPAALASLAATPDDR